MRHTAFAFLLGIATAAACVALFTSLNTRAQVRDNQICSLSAAIQYVLTDAWRRVPPGRQYNQARTNLATYIGKIKDANPC